MISKKKDYVAEFLLASARDKISQIVIVLITIHILREYSQTTKASIDLAQRTLMRWPLNFRLRYTYSNCLNMTKSREYRLEALKQRIIGCNLELFNERNKKYAKYEDYQHIISRHFGRLENINEFLEGKKSYPSKHVQKMIQTREKSDDRLLKILQKLEEVGDLLELPQQVIKTSGFVCILDTNAISNFKVSDIL